MKTSDKASSYNRMISEDAQMVICPIARAVHCTGCALVKICPAKTFLGDYGKEDEQASENQEALRVKSKPRDPKTDSKPGV